MNGCSRPGLKIYTAVGLIIFLLGFCLPVFGAPPEMRSNNGDEEGYAPQLSKTTITIEKKSLDKIYTLSGSFAISPETLIVGLDGKEVSIKKMLVPCDAEVSYAIENGVRKAYRIDIRRVVDGANWQWTSEKPE
jgi:hypothetical protein